MLITPAFAQSSGGLAEGGFGLLPIIFVMLLVMNSPPLML